MNQNFIIEAKTSEFPKRQFKIIKEIGWGGEGQIFEAEVKEWKKEIPNKVAIKKQQRLNQNEEKLVEAIMKYQEEIESQKSNKQPPSQLVRIYDLIKMDSEYTLVMELGESNLLFYLQNNKPSLKNKLEIMIQLSQSIRFFHQDLNSIHRDIKPENFIYIGDQFKLIDFGSVRNNADSGKTIKVGTTQYQALEVVEGQSSYTQAIDIWSLGCVFFELLSSQALFDGKNQIEVIKLISSTRNDQKYLNEKINSITEDEGIKKLLLKMLEPDCKQRISIISVLQMLNRLLYQQNHPIQKPIGTQVPNFLNQPPKFQTQLNQIQLNNGLQNNINQQAQLNQFILNQQDYHSQHLQQNSQIQGKLTQLQNVFEKSLENQEQNKISIQKEFKEFQQQFQTKLSNQLENYFEKINKNLQAESNQIIEQKNIQIQELNIKVEQLNNQVLKLKQEFQEYVVGQLKMDHQQFMEIFHKINKSNEENKQSCQEHKLLNQQMKDTIKFYLNHQRMSNEKSIPNLNSQVINHPQNNYNQSMLNVSMYNLSNSQSYESGLIDQRMHFQKQSAQQLNQQIQVEISSIQQQLQHSNYIDLSKKINTLNNLKEQFITQFKSQFSAFCHDYNQIIQGLKIKILDLKEQFKGQYQEFSISFQNLSEDLTSSISSLTELESYFQEKNTQMSYK